MPRYPYRASLVIPLFNKVEYTAACLTSISEHTDPDLYEVVLVDNGSTDATGELLAALDGDVQVIRNEVNRGFAVASNQGAAAARGERIVFVNNDIVAHPGWLEPLLAVLDEEPRVAVVGARLLYPDGTLQHGGVVTFVDPAVEAPFSAVHFPHRTAPSTAATRQDADVVTGAVMATRRGVFHRLGGFDEGYWNGNEDVDLCLRVRADGLRVVYQPASTLTHHESVSGPERFSRVDDNQRRLFERWGGRYNAQFVVDENHVLRPNPARERYGAFPPVRTGRAAR